MKKVMSLLVTIFFLTQSAPLPQGGCAEFYPLIPPTKVNANDPNIPFTDWCGVISTALIVYKMDVLEECTKDELMATCARVLSRISEARFDLNQINPGEKGWSGWTRYYPFSVGTAERVVRIFRRDEAYLQPKEMVYFEDSIDITGTTKDGEKIKLSLTFQILPGINEIIKTCRIKPFNIDFSRDADRCP